MPKIETADDDGKRTVEVFKNEEGKYYFDVDATEELVKAEDLIVDQDVVALKKGEMDKDLVIKAGNYSFDKTIGEYGAYRIYLE